MRLWILSVIIFPITLIIPLRAHATAEGITGWGPFKFSMTAWQAAHVPGAFMSKSGNIVYSSIVDNETVRVVVEFSQTRDSIDNIDVEFPEKYSDNESCLAAKSKLTDSISKKYGKSASRNNVSIDIIKQYYDIVIFQNKSFIKIWALPDDMPGPLSQGCSVGVNYSRPHATLPHAEL